MRWPLIKGSSTVPKINLDDKPVENRDVEEPGRVIIQDVVTSPPQPSSSKNIFSIVESVFPEHKYLQNQRTTYVERLVKSVNR